MCWPIPVVYEVCPAVLDELRVTLFEKSDFPSPRRCDSSVPKNIVSSKKIDQVKDGQNKPTEGKGPKKARESDLLIRTLHTQESYENTKPEAVFQRTWCRPVQVLCMLPVFR